MNGSPSVLVAGVGMVPFHKPGRSEDYDVMGAGAAAGALRHAGVEMRDIQAIFSSCVYADTTSGQSIAGRLGHTGVPIVNVNNACASGSTALWAARQAIASGDVEVALVVGSEVMTRGALDAVFKDRVHPIAPYLAAAARRGPAPALDTPPLAVLFGNAAARHQALYGTRDETLARIAVKARQHARHNPYAVFKDLLEIEQVLSSPRLHGSLTRLQACPPTCGAAAAVLVSKHYARRKGLSGPAIRIAAQVLVSDDEDAFDDSRFDADLQLVGQGSTRRCATEAYDRAGVGPRDVDVLEVHDCFTINELLAIEALGLAADGEGERLILDGDTTHGGRWVVNPSGGLLAKGHPLGATGLAQCVELVLQLRGEAQDRQVSNAKVALQHNIGLAGACAVSIYIKEAATT